MIHEPSIRPGESVSGLDKWIASKLWRANARDDVVSVDDLREFMKGKVLVDAEDLKSALDCIVKHAQWFDESHPYRRSYNALSRALLPTTPDQANEQ